jgi:diguanylate cyclase (GGDEF)-like protein
MSDRADDQAAAKARHALHVLTAEANRVRAELAKLRRDLADAQGDFGATRAAQLLEANEQLVMSALHARMLADTAREDLETLTRTSQFDELTDTPNRSVMLDRIENAISQARRHGKHAAILFIDLDGFKLINDSRGHAVGDDVLQRVAYRLSHSVRDSDTVSRFGGDEFLVLLAEVSGASDVALVATKILLALALPGEGGDAASGLSASIGIALFPDDGADPGTLIKCADAAMYRAKRRGGGTFQFHSDVPYDDVHSVAPAAANVARNGATVDRPSSNRQSQEASDLRDANEQLVVSAVAAHQFATDAKEVQRRQIKFLAMVAHELRNPLMPMRTATDLLEKARGDDTMLSRLQVLLRRQIGYMARLIDDLLDGARASTGKFRLEHAHVDMNAILGQAVDACRPAMELRKQRFTIRVESAAMAVRGDAMRLTQVMVNLLDNASKYTPNGGHIELEAEADADVLTIAVSDDGIGVTSEALPRIFDLFEQETHALAHHGGGLGIGLSIVRELTEAHGGTIVASSPGKGLGSRFVISLPREPSDAGAEAVEAQPAPD